VGTHVRNSKILNCPKLSKFTLQNENKVSFNSFNKLSYIIRGVKLNNKTIRFLVRSFALNVYIKVSTKH
jgi:hypothetical protein